MTNTVNNNTTVANMSQEALALEVGYQHATSTMIETKLPEMTAFVRQLTGYRLILRDATTNKVLTVHREMIEGKPAFKIMENDKTEKQADWIYVSGAFQGLVLDITLDDLKDDVTFKSLRTKLRTNPKVYCQYSFQVGIADGEKLKNIPKGQAYINWDAAGYAEIPDEVHFSTWRALDHMLKEHGITLSKKRFGRPQPKGNVVTISEEEEPTVHTMGGDDSGLRATVQSN